ncbi:MAG: glutamine amidotransferase [Bifidobacteriaceae bacterium]|jgi:CobQ-like glutamine amidotransferase family enzyme|nr:glutamine amidotransferase [Bifidobacteriaceae bacterium]
MELGAGEVGIVHLYPTLMGTYGDGGNVKVLVKRLAARGLGCRVETVDPGQPVPEQADLYVLGGGEDVSQVAAARALRESGALGRAAGRGAVVFAVCAGLQVLGHSFEVAGGKIEPGLGLVDATTRRREPRAVGEVLARPLEALLAGSPLLSGYENHGGGTDLGPGAKPLARVVAGVGNGGGAAGDGWEGLVQGRIWATYLHGPVLARNPALADRLLALALGGAAEPPALAPFAAPFVADLRAEREAYTRSGKLSAESARTRR